MLPRTLALLLGLRGASAWSQRGVLHGPHEVEETLVTVPGMALDESRVDVWYPVASGGNHAPFRFLCFAHGAGGGSVVQPFVYYEIMRAVASWGYVVAAPRACLDGVCPDDDYPTQQTRVVDWVLAHREAAPFDGVDFSKGVGIFGHSMGGRATYENSAAAVAAAHNISAAALLHAFVPVAEAEPAIPFLAFTGMNDTTADYRMTERLYARAKAGTPRGLVNRIDAGHQEPSNWEGWLEYDGYNPKMAQFVVGWMKLFLDGVSTDRGVDWEELIFGDSDVALCHGGDGAMARCETRRS
jgi:dienelactone hydrolase